MGLSWAFGITGLYYLPDPIIIFCACTILYFITKKGRHKTLSLRLPFLLIVNIFCWDPYEFFLFISCFLYYIRSIFSLGFPLRKRLSLTAAPASSNYYPNQINLPFLP